MLAGCQKQYVEPFDVDKELDYCNAQITKALDALCEADGSYDYTMMPRNILEGEFVQQIITIIVLLVPDFRKHVVAYLGKLLGVHFHGQDIENPDQTEELQCLKFSAGKIPTVHLRLRTDKTQPAAMASHGVENHSRALTH